MSQWGALNTHGLDQSKYFVIAMDRHRDDLRHLTADEMAELLVADWADLAPLWPLLQEDRKSLATPAPRKSSPVVESTRRLTTPYLDSFNPESTGPRAAYTIAHVIRADRLHGLVVNALSNEFQRAGRKVASNKARDLAVLNDAQQVEIVFEVKTDSSTFDIYAGVGQLLLHSAADNPEPRRVLVLPKPVNERVEQALKKLEIQILLYNLPSGKSVPTFKSLSDFLT